MSCKVHIFPFPADGVVNHSSDVNNPQEQFINKSERDEGFTIKLWVNSPQLDQDDEIAILDIPDVINLYFRKADPVYRDSENHPVFTAKDGSLVVLESDFVSNISYEKPFQRVMTIGLPLNMTASLKGDQEVMLNVTKAYFTIYADGRIVDNNFPARFPGWWLAMHQ